VIKDSKPLSELEHLNQAARQMLDQLAWWTAPSNRRARRVYTGRPSRRKPMTITLNHTIVSARDKDAAARFFVFEGGTQAKTRQGISAADAARRDRD
jgi:hypothetical protein